MTPIPVLDHVVINVQDRMDAAQALYTRLGFTLTPRGHHTLGSINHLAMFGTDYLELIGAPEGGQRLDIMGWPMGLNAVVFATEDAAATQAALVAQGVDCLPPRDFSRPVALDGGQRDAAFRTANLSRGESDAGRYYFCQHFTRDLVWRDEWRRHANGTRGVIGVVQCSDDPKAAAALYQRMFGAQALTAVPGGWRLSMALSSLDVIDPRTMAEFYGATAPDAQGRADHLAALVLCSPDLAQTASILTEAGIAFAEPSPGRLVVPADQAMGTTLEFRPA
jgi:catechol 2,3-dioxygenase-like lactoylglutathione lyase family enzyme